MDLEIPTARVFRPLLDEGIRYRAAWGGRGSGKSHFFAGSIVERCVMTHGLRVVCLREVQKDLRDSAKLLISDKIAEMQTPGFDVQAAEIKTPGGGVVIFKGMKDYTADSIKSLEGFDIAWVEEAANLSATSLQLLRPTLRKAGSELWFSWNPKRKTDPVDLLFRGDMKPANAVVVKANWDSNPWFSKELADEREHDLLHSPSYRHIWEGEYATVVDGAYFATQLAQARDAGRITELAVDPLVELRAFWDIGIEDSMALWIAQFNSRRIDVLDYREGQGQSLAYYVNWLRSNGYGNALCVLPHDGARRGFADAMSFDQHLKDAGFRTKVVKNQGQGAAMLRIEAMRRLFPRMWFDEKRCAAGLEALGAYHERRNETRQIGLGPNHDWASHAADSAGLMAITYEEPKTSLKVTERADSLGGSGGWMAS